MCQTGAQGTGQWRPALAYFPPKAGHSAMKLRSIAAVYTLVGAVVFLIGGILLGLGRFGPGVLMMIVCIIFLAASGRAQRRSKR